MRTIWKSVVRAIKRRTWRNARCVFVFSTGRVGTVTTINLLHLSPEVEAFHEPEPLLLMEGKAAYGDLKSRWPEYRAVFTEARYEPIGRCAVRRKVYAEAALFPALGPMIAQTLPRAKFIHLYRHPGDVVRSGMRRGWYRNHPWDPYRAEPSPGSTDRKLWDTEWDAFAKGCWFWHHVNGFILDFAAGLAADRVLAMPFEDLTNPDTGAWRKVFGFAGVEAPEESLARQVLCVRANEQITGEFPTFAEWSSDQHQTLERIAGVTMRRLGYNHEARSLVA